MYSNSHCRWFGYQERLAGASLNTTGSGETLARESKNVDHLKSLSLPLQVIAGIDTAVRSMHVGGIRRVVIPPSQGYQNKEQGPVPPDVSPASRESQGHLIEQRARLDSSSTFRDRH
jgi:hypothetical protein